MSPNPIVHFEIGCTNGPETREFFSALFDWNIGGPQAGFMIETGEEGTIPGHIVELAPESGIYVTVYVQVDDLEATLARASELGGKTLVGPVEIPGRGSSVPATPRESIPPFSGAPSGRCPSPARSRCSACPSSRRSSH